MALTLLLDHVTLPERGAVKLDLQRTFVISVSAEDAQRHVKQWLLREASYMLTSGVPTLLVGDQVV